MVEEIRHDRRRFIASAIMTIACAELGMIGSSAAQSSKHKPATVPAIKPGTHTSFGSLKQIDAGLLNVGYAEAGPTNGATVILLHGWPYDIYSFVDVAPLLASAGYRVIVPYVRGYGTTRFLSSETFRNGNRRQSLLTPSPSWMLSKSTKRFSLVLIGGRERPISSGCFGRSAARPWFR